MDYNRQDGYIFEEICPNMKQTAHFSLTWCIPLRLRQSALLRALAVFFEPVWVRGSFSPRSMAVTRPTKAVHRTLRFPSIGGESGLNSPFKDRNSWERLKNSPLFYWSSEKVSILFTAYCYKLQVFTIDGAFQGIFSFPGLNRRSTLDWRFKYQRSKNVVIPYTRMCFVFCTDFRLDHPFIRHSSFRALTFNARWRLKILTFRFPSLLAYQRSTHGLMFL